MFRISGFSLRPLKRRFPSGSFNRARRRRVRRPAFSLSCAAFSRRKHLLPLPALFRTVLTLFNLFRLFSTIFGLSVAQKELWGKACTDLIFFCESFLICIFCCFMISLLPSGSQKPGDWTAYCPVPRLKRFFSASGRPFHGFSASAPYSAAAPAYSQIT